MCIIPKARENFRSRGQKRSYVLRLYAKATMDVLNMCPLATFRGGRPWSRNIWSFKLIVNERMAHASMMLNSVLRSLMHDRVVLERMPSSKSSMRESTTFVWSSKVIHKFMLRRTSRTSAATWRLTRKRVKVVVCFVCGS
jgi:hypothetical protein